MSFVYSVKRPKNHHLSCHANLLLLMRISYVFFPSFFFTACGFTHHWSFASNHQSSGCVVRRYFPTSFPAFVFRRLYVNFAHISAFVLPLISSSRIVAIHSN